MEEHNEKEANFNKEHDECKEELNNIRKERKRISNKKYSIKNREKSNSDARIKYNSLLINERSRYKQGNYEKYKEKALKKSKERIVCECGKNLSKGSLRIHKFSKIHKKIMEQKNLN